MSKYFSPSEFRRCTPPCDITDMKAAFLARMDDVREAAGIPLVLNSAYRSVEYEKKHGRPGTSSHCKGLALDIRCNSYANRWKIVTAAIRCGVTRIGIGKTYVHLDMDPEKQQGVIWDYYA